MSDIRTILEESGMSGDQELARTLADLKQLASQPAPTPTGALADLLGARRKRRPWRTALIVIGAVVASLGIGVSTASAVSPQFRDSTVKVFDDIARVVAPPAPTPTPTETERHGGGSDDVPGTDDNGGTHGGTDDGVSGGSGTSGDDGGGHGGGSDDGGSSGKGKGGNG